MLPLIVCSYYLLYSRYFYILSVFIYHWFVMASYIITFLHSYILCLIVFPVLRIFQESQDNSLCCLLVVVRLRICIQLFNYCSSDFNPSNARQNRSRRHSIFTFFSEKVRLRISCESSHEMSSLIFSEKNNSVVCCSCD